MSYWVNTSSNDLINNILRNSEEDIFDELELLFKGKSIEKSIDVFSDFHDMKNPQEIWYLLLHSGYLTAVKRLNDGKYELIIPNKEVESFFERDNKY